MQGTDAVFNAQRLPSDLSYLAKKDGIRLVLALTNQSAPRVLPDVTRPWIKLELPAIKPSPDALQSLYVLFISTSVAPIYIMPIGLKNIN